MPEVNLGTLQKQLDAAIHELENLPPGESTRERYKRFTIKNTIRKLKAQMRKQRATNKLKNQRQYWKVNTERTDIQKAYQNLTWADIGYTSAEEVRQSSMNEAIKRCREKFKKQRLTVPNATDIVKLLDERTNNLLGKDK